MNKNETDFYKTIVFTNSIGTRADYFCRVFNNRYIVKYQRMKNGDLVQIETVGESLIKNLKIKTEEKEDEFFIIVEYENGSSYKLGLPCQGKFNQEDVCYTLNQNKATIFIKLQMRYFWATEISEYLGLFRCGNF